MNEKIVNSINLEEEFKITKLSKKDQVDMTKYSQEEIEKATSLAQKIDSTNVNSIVNFGVDLQNSLNNYSNEIINNIRSNDSGEIGEVINDLLHEINYIDVDPSQSNGLMRVVQNLPIIGRFVKSAQKMISRYDKVSNNVDDIVLKLDKSRLSLIKDNTALNKMREKNFEFIKDLSEHICAAEIKSNDLQNEIENYVPIDEFDYTLSDKKGFLNRLEKKVMDLKLTKTIATQSIPQISIIQENNSIVVEKIQSSVTNTIPLWRNQLAIALSLEKQKKTLEIQRNIYDTTNKILVKNSEKLKANSIEAAKQNEETIVSMDSIRKVNQDLISTLDEIIRIKDEGSKKRIEISKELMVAEEELRSKVLNVKGNTQKQLK